MCSSFEPSRSSSSIIEPNRIGFLQPPENLKLAALRLCIDRVNSVIKQARWVVHSDALLDLHCSFIKTLPTTFRDLDRSFTKTLPTDPVIAACGHIFEKTRIIELQNLGHRQCAICSGSILQFTPAHDVRKFIESQVSQEPVLTCSNFKEEDKELADRSISLAKDFIKRKNYDAALATYSIALQYTKSSADYAAIPDLYDQRKESKQAALSSLYLSLYQIQEEKLREAALTLEKCNVNCLEVDFNVSAFITALHVHDRPASLSMKMAAYSKKCEDKMLIYRLIILYNPDQWDAYQELSGLIEDPLEKVTFLLKAADEAHIAGKGDVEKKFREEARKWMPISISTEEWSAPNKIKLPPYPQKLKDFLEGDCTIWLGKKRSETHIVVPLFPKVAINGADPIPFTLDSLNQLDRSSDANGGCTGILSLENFKSVRDKEEFCYGVMTKYALDESLNKSYDEQKQLLPEGYEVPSLFNAATALLWEYRRTGINYAFGVPTRCKDLISEEGGPHMVIGSGVPFTPLNASNNYNDDKNGFVGLRGWKGYFYLGF